MSPLRTRARIVGFLFILAAVSSIIGLLLYAPILNHSDYVVSGKPVQAQIATAAFMEVILAVSMIGISIWMFPVVKRYSETLAIGYVCFRLLESTIVIVGILCMLSAVTLGQAFGQMGAEQTGPYLVVARMLVAVHDWTFLMGPNTALGVSTLMMGFVLFHTRLVPRPIAVLGLVGGPLIFVSSILVMFGLYGQTSSVGAVMALPVFLYEMSLAIWLMVRGFNPEVTRNWQDSPRLVSAV
ncbi:DUF4386 domain-containing protein [Deinococcus cellulosilyticus]|uniref:DUF4386 domain-containing protein n=1 Tax=Deinococcus cellulosilyticus (strain DSM 18568 / NBRC 106333 / KACC 11606 / 5516J-15) TaxID=1223518 RepID=A0A511MWB2_DEIC1|nr:DUF4386 domain-containing protein [Deinococcus cellulosilyticus]GEM44548.1 hypothetical protein DC3_01830 [Deinococcus cellulosilyticus NBRC 106333 = KACC 11606]